MRPNLPIARKNYQKNGKWIAKPFKTAVMVCACGGNYIVTRKDQTLCVRCMYSVKV